MVTLRHGSATDVGRVRTNNEDALFISDRLYVVADGMGGHQGGEVASENAVRTMRETFVESKHDGLLEAARRGKQADIDRAADVRDLHGMGTTLVAIAPTEDGDALAWIN